MLLNTFIEYFGGYDVYSFDDVCASDVAQKISEAGILFEDMKINRNGKFTFRAKRNDFREIGELFAEIEYSVKRKGLPALFSRYRRRPGIVVGLAAFLLTLCFSQNFVWRIDVSGNNAVDSEAILEKLDSLGCSIGSYIPDIDFYNLCTRYVATDDEISWISVNRLGGYVTVEVLETKYREVLRSDSEPSNMVAKCDGRIEYISAYSGIPAVRDGESVYAGQLLISGVWEDKNDGEVRYVRAEGEVMAHTLHEICADAPLVYTEREYSEKTVVKRKYSLFGFELPQIGKEKRINGEYEAEKQKYPLVLFDRIYLPIFVSETVYYPYVESSIERSESEAIKKAESEIAKKVKTELTECEISVRSSEGHFEEDENGILHYRLTVSFLCYENIAEEAFISVRD